MADTTPVHQIPYPEASDPADVPGRMQQLAARIDAVMVSQTQGDQRWVTPDGGDGRWLQLAGGTLSGGLDLDGNSLLGAVVQAARLVAYSEQVVDHGTVSGTVTVDVAAGTVHVLALAGAATLEFTGWPASAAASVTVEVDLDGNALTIESAVEWPGGDPPDPGEGFAKLVFDSRPGRQPHGQLVGTEYA